MNESKKLNPSARKPKRFAERKSAFDATMAAYRNSRFTGIGAAGISDASAGTKNPARPNLIEFRADVEKIVESVLTDVRALWYFYATYIHFDSQDEIEREMFADRMLGKSRHATEQEIGLLFIQRGLYSVQKYFTSVRKPRAK